jgi:hypothetical protein
MPEDLGVWVTLVNYVTSYYKLVITKKGSHLGQVLINLVYYELTLLILDATVAITRSSAG